MKRIACTLALLALSACTNVIGTEPSTPETVSGSYFGTIGPQVMTMTLVQGERAQGASFIPITGSGTLGTLPQVITGNYVTPVVGRNGELTLVLTSGSTTTRLTAYVSFLPYTALTGTTSTGEAVSLHRE